MSSLWGFFENFHPAHSFAYLCRKTVRQEQQKALSEVVNYYKVLGISTDSSKKGIIKAYRRMALKTHPDKNQGKKSEEFIQVSAAYETLIDDDKRRSYDWLLQRGGKMRTRMTLRKAEDIFTDVFSDLKEATLYIGTQIRNVDVSQFYAARVTDDSEPPRGTSKKSTSTTTTTTELPLNHTESTSSSSTSKKTQRISMPKARENPTIVTRLRASRASDAPTCVERKTLPTSPSPSSSSFSPWSSRSPSSSSSSSSSSPFGGREKRKSARRNHEKKAVEKSRCSRYRSTQEREEATSSRGRDYKSPYSTSVSSSSSRSSVMAPSRRAEDKAITEQTHGTPSIRQCSTPREEHDGGHLLPRQRLLTDVERQILGYIIAEERGPGWRHEAAMYMGEKKDENHDDMKREHTSRNDQFFGEERATTDAKEHTSEKVKGQVRNTSIANINDDQKNDDKNCKNRNSDYNYSNNVNINDNYKYNKSGNNDNSKDHGHKKNKNQNDDAPRTRRMVRSKLQEAPLLHQQIIFSQAQAAPPPHHQPCLEAHACGANASMRARASHRRLLADRIWDKWERSRDSHAVNGLGTHNDNTNETGSGCFTAGGKTSTEYKHSVLHEASSAHSSVKTSTENKASSSSTVAKKKPVSTSIIPSSKKFKPGKKHTSVQLFQPSERGIKVDVGAQNFL